MNKLIEILIGGAVILLWFMFIWPLITPYIPAGLATAIVIILVVAIIVWFVRLLTR